MYFDFSSSNFKIKHQKTGKTLATVSGLGDLYFLDLPKSTALFVRYSQRASKDIWHVGLCILSPKILRLLHSIKLINVWLKKPTISTSCQLGKATNYLPPLHRISILPFQKIHCDLWGPSPVTSLQNLDIISLL